MGFDSYENAYNSFLHSHLKQRKGERLRRLKEGHGHAEKLFLEKVWWPALGHFNDLHPEYEVCDFKDGQRYLDFAYIQSHYRVAVEIDGFGPHWRNASRWQFSDSLIRQNHLVIDGWRVLRFAFDDIIERPRLCQQTIQQLMGKLLGGGIQVNQATVEEKEIIRLAIRLNRPITPLDVAEHVMIGKDYAHKLLHGLVAKQWFKPASGQIRVRSYRLDIHAEDFVL